MIRWSYLPAALAMFIMCPVPRASADTFKFIICGDSQYPWGCCDCNSHCDGGTCDTNGDGETSDAEKAAGQLQCMANCANNLCNSIDASDTDEQSAVMNQAYVRAMNQQAAADADILAVIMNGDATAFGHGSELDKFKEFYEDDLDLELWPGLGNHDYENNVDDCADNGCAWNMVNYLQDRATTLGADLCAAGVISEFRFDWDVGDTYYEFPINRRDHEGSLAYSFDMGDFHFVQLHNNPSYEVTFDSWNDGAARQDNFEITACHDWLRSDLRAARRRGKRVVINLHDWGSTSSDADFREAIAETNVEAIFVAHFHSRFGKSGGFDSTYAPRAGLPDTVNGGGSADYNIPVYYSGSPMYGRYLLVTFPPDVPIIVEEVDISANSGDAAVMVFEDPLPQAAGTLEPAADYHCELPASVEAAADLRLEIISDLPEIRFSQFFSGDQTVLTDSGGTPVSNDCGEEIVARLSSLPAGFTADPDAAIGLDPESGSLVPMIGLIKGDTLGDSAGNTQLLSERWPNLPTEFHSNIDAAFRTPSGTVFLFQDANFVGYSEQSDDVTFPSRPIVEFFPVPVFFQNELDAALFTDENTLFLFKGDQYVELLPFDRTFLSSGLILDAFGLEVDVGPAPIVTPGDTCENPITIGTNTGVGLSTRDAQADPPFGGESFCLRDFGADRWFLWTAPVTGPAALELELDPQCTAGDVLRLGVYDAETLRAAACGADDPALDPVLTNCELFECGGHSLLGFSAVAGTDYLVRVGAAGDSAKDAFLRILQDPPPPPPPPPRTNDSCSDYFSIEGDGTFGFFGVAATTDALAEPSDLPDACGGFERDVWYLWTAQSFGLVTIELCGHSGTEGQIAVYDELPCAGAFTPLACAQGDCASGPSATFPVRAGASYMLRLGTSGAATDPAVPGTVMIATDPDDGREPNQGCQQATPLLPGEYPGIAMDEDWFRLSVPALGSIELLLELDSANGELDLILQEGCGEAAMTLAESATDGNVETVSFVNPAASDRLVFARILPRDSSPVARPYTLKVTLDRDAVGDLFEENDRCAEAVPMGSGTFDGLTVRGSDADWYRLRIPRRGRVDLEAMYDTGFADLDVFLHGIPDDGSDCPGPILAPFRPSANGKTLTYTERVGVFDHFLGVTSLFPIPVVYRLDLRIDDRFQNNECAQAALLEPGGYADLMVSTDAPDWFQVEVGAGQTLAVELEPVAGESGVADLRLLDACGGTELAVGVGTPGGRRLVFANEGGLANPILAIALASPAQASLYYTLTVSVFEDCDGDGVTDASEIAGGDCVEPALDDRFEENDSCAAPAEILAGSHAGLMLTVDDPDWYRLRIPREGALAVEVAFDGALAQSDVFLHGRIEGGECPGPLLSPSRATEDGVSITYNQRADVVEHLLVLDPSVAVVQEYALDIRIDDRFDNHDCTAAARLEPGLHDELAVSAAAPDWFLVEVGEGQTLEVGIDAAVSVRLFDVCDGAEIATLMSTPEGNKIVYLNDGPAAVLPFVVDADPALPTVYYTLDVQVSGGDTPPGFVRGDCDGDANACSGVNDAVVLLSWLFLGSQVPPCRAACDPNGDGALELSDAVYGLNFCFLGLAPPVAPYPDCGPGTETDLQTGCETLPPACP